MEFLTKILINIEYYIYFICIGETFFRYKRRHMKYQKIPVVLIAIMISGLWNDIGVFGRVSIHLLSVIIILLIYFQEKWAKIAVLYFLVMILLSMFTPMFEMLIESLFLVCHLVLEEQLIRLWAHTLLLIYVWGIGRYFKKRFLNRIDKIEKIYFIFLIAVLIVDATIVVILGDFIRTYEATAEKLSLILIYIFIVIGILTQIILLINALITRNISKENELLAKQFLDSQKDHYEYLEKRETETKRFRHDIKNHIIVMNELLHNKEYEEIEHYLTALSENVNRYSNRITVNNGIADAIINKFYYDAQEHGIHMQVRGHFPVECKILAYDICTILSNLLSNAITAATECVGRKEILVDIRYTEEDIIILVENDYMHELKIKDNTYLTTKADTYTHGFGLENIKECVERNNGYLSISTENNRFKVMLSIRNAKEE